MNGSRGASGTSFSERRPRSPERILILAARFRCSHTRRRYGNPCRTRACAASVWWSGLMGLSSSTEGTDDECFHGPSNRQRCVQDRDGRGRGARGESAGGRASGAGGGPGRGGRGGG